MTTATMTWVMMTTTTTRYMNKTIITSIETNKKQYGYIILNGQYDDYGGGYDTQRAGGGSASGFESYFDR